MEKYKDVKDIVCPFCGTKPKLVSVSNYHPELYCADCKVSLSYRKNWSFSKFVFDSCEYVEYCKTHNIAGAGGCYKCEQEKKQVEFSKLKFNKNQLIFLSEYHCRVYDLAKIELEKENKK